MINKLTTKIAYKIGEELHSTQENVQIWAYGLEIIFSCFIKLFIILFLSFLFGIFDTTSIVLLTFIPFRTFGGGVHLSTYLRCLSVGIIIFLLLGKIATLNIDINLYKWFIFGTVVLGLFTIIKWVPADTQKKQIKDKNKRIFQKKKTFMVLIVWVILILILYINYKYEYVFSLILGAFASFIFINPLGYFIMNSIDKVLDNVKDVLGGEMHV